MAYDSPFPSPYPEEPKPAAQEALGAAAGADNPSNAMKPESVWTEEITEDNFPPERPVFHEPPVPADQKTPEDLFEAEEPESKNTMRIFEIGAVVLLIIISGAFFYFRNDQPPQNFDVSGVISAKTGGTVSYTDANGRIATVIIPKNALAEDTRIEIRRVAAGSVTDMYRLLPANIKFLKPVTIAIPYKESGLKKGQKPEDIKLKYWVGEGGLPLELEYEIYPNGKRLGAQVMGF